jgi:predicted Co/Zn/Cd cation transporter (cation efflux family)
VNTETAPKRTPAEVERHGLRISVIAALGMAALGIGFAIPTDSRAVLLDGVFSLVGFAVGLVAIHVATLVLRRDDEHFHFGYSAHEPMLKLTKGLLIAFVSLLAAWSSIESILDGGRKIAGRVAVVYAVAAAAGCLVYSDWPGTAVDNSYRLNVTYTMPVGFGKN